MGPRSPQPPQPPSAAFAQLFEHCAGVVRGTFRRLRVPTRDRDDVEQDTWLSIFNALTGMGGSAPSAPDKFAGTIAYRTAVDHLRAARRRPDLPASPDDPEPVDENLTSEEQAMRNQQEKQARALVMSLLDELPLKERSVVVLADFEPKRTLREIAEELGIDEEAVRSRHRRAYEHMRQSLARRRQAPEATTALVAALTLEELLALEAPVPPMSNKEKARVWSRLLETLGKKALVAGAGAAAVVLTTKQAVAGALLVFLLGGAADEVWRGTHDARPPAAALAPRMDKSPSELLASAAPILAEDGPAVLAVAPVTTPEQLSRKDGEWQAIRDARALLRRKPPSPDEAQRALARVHSEELRAVRDRLREEAETLKRER